MNFSTFQEDTKCIIYTSKHDENNTKEHDISLIAYKREDDIFHQPFLSADKVENSNSIKSQHKNGVNFETSSQSKMTIRNDSSSRSHRKTYTCDLCNKQLSNRISVKSHIEGIHFQTKSHICHLCDYKTTFRHCLKKHIDQVHNQIKNYKCDLCDFKATFRHSLKKHIDEVHNKIKNYKCDFCDYKSYKRSSLNKHVAGVHKKIAAS